MWQQGAFTLRFRRSMVRVHGRRCELNSFGKLRTSRNTVLHGSFGALAFISVSLYGRFQFGGHIFAKFPILEPLNREVSLAQYGVPITVHPGPEIHFEI
jgi:hypothetical protein